MAREVLGLGKQLAAEATCPLCLDLFAEPVLTACGHSFCRQCLEGVLGNPPRPAACPQCRAAVEPGSLHPNLSLRAMAGLARAMEEVATRPRCPEHGELLALFCEPCSAPLCALCELCRDGPQHHQHRVRPADEAARELRETLQSNLLSLQKQKEKLKTKGDQKTAHLLATLVSETQCVRDTLEELQQFLKEQGDILLAQFEQMYKEILKESDEYNSRVLERESLLDTVIAQIEEKRDQPAVEFLMDVGKILSSCEAAKAPIPEPVSPELQRSIKNLSEMRQVVLDMVAKFKVKLQSQTDSEREQVTLDPETASPHLTLSQDLKTIRLGGGKQKQKNPNLPDTSKRFTGSPSVLGSQGFTSGRHYWEVEVGKGNSWAVGVALESVQRKESLSMAMGKIWALRLDWDGQYRTLRMPPVPLELREELQRIRVHLDYEAGRVTFYNAKNMTQILQLEATFTEKVFPYFWLWSQENHIRLCD